MQEMRKIVIDVTSQETGLFATSEQLPGLNVLATKKMQLIRSVRQAIEYLYLHNEKCKVRVWMEIPNEFFEEQTQDEERMAFIAEKAA